ncbi:MAG: 7TM diverse intracellular signaling domain-containing protein [Flavobacteriales bacterium]
MSSCAKKQEVAVDYSFETAINSEHGVEYFDQINFKPQESLDLGFYEGNVWIKLNITNGDAFESYIVMMGDLINRNYRFYKLDTATKTINPVTIIEDLALNDHRSFNNPKPNFKINLEPHEKATFYISTHSDGRILQATPELMKIDSYQVITGRNKLFNILFFVAIGMLLLVNIFHWSILKNKIYYFYGFYILSSCLFYLFVEGSMYGLGLSHVAVDHLMFLSIRLWIFSVVVFTAKFLDVNLTYPKFYKLLKWGLIVFLGGVTLYQCLFFSSSISHLHMLENLFGFVWIVVTVSMIVISLKKRTLQAKYYLIAYGFLIGFVMLGLVDSHATILPGDPFSYFKIGTITEFSGFTYFIAVIIRGNLRKAAVLETELIKNKQELQELSKLLESKFGNTSLKMADEKADLEEGDSLKSREEGKSKIELSEEEQAKIEESITSELNRNDYYKTPDISLAKLAALTSIPAYKISITLNQKMDTTFYDLINSKRVEASLKLLQENKNLTIEAITADVGFKSKSTFYRAFKKYKGITPTDYLSNS